MTAQFSPLISDRGGAMCGRTPLPRPYECAAHVEGVHCTLLVRRRQPSSDNLIFKRLIGIASHLKRQQLCVNLAPKDTFIVRVLTHPFHEAIDTTQAIGRRSNRILGKRSYLVRGAFFTAACFGGSRFSSSHFYFRLALLWKFIR